MGLRLWSPTFAAKLDARLADAITMSFKSKASNWRVTCSLHDAGRSRPMHVPSRNMCSTTTTASICSSSARSRPTCAIPSRWIGATYSFVQWRKLRAFEAAVCRAADHVLAVSDADAAALQRLVPGLEVTVVPNGIDVASYAPRPPRLRLRPSGGRSGRSGLGLYGTMDFRPNVDAALWFAHEVRRSSGSRSPARASSSWEKTHRRLDVLRGRPDVPTTGAVDDTRPYIAGAGVYVVPLRMGGGTRFKILGGGGDEQGDGQHVTRLRRISGGNGRELVIADSPREFADAVIALMRDPARRAELGARARAGKL